MLWTSQIKVFWPEKTSQELTLRLTETRQVLTEEVFVPLSLYLTRGQEPANCATNRAACKIDINCMKPLKNIILTEPATCKILDFKRDVVEGLMQIRGCMAKGWCPEEDIFNPEITYRKVTMTYTDLNFSVAAIAIHGNDRMMNLQNNAIYPANHANKFNVCLTKLTIGAEDHGYYRLSPQRFEQGWSYDGNSNFLQLP